MSSSPPSSLTISGYLIARLQQLGINTAIGVPGDFQLLLCTRLREHGMQWVGSANELNGAYAADGFARTSHGPSLLVTTFGVGQLSAFNGIAGAQAEKVPVIHVVGTPATFKQHKGLLLHHSLGDRRFNVFAEMSKHITGAQLDLYDLWKDGRIPQADPSSNREEIVGGDDLGREIDRVLEYAVRASRPVDINFPQDLVDVPVNEVVKKRLQTPLNTAPAPNDPHIENFVRDEIVRRVLESQRPIVVGDICAARHNLEGTVNAFIQQTGLPYFSTPMGRGMVDEIGNPQFGGVYAGAQSRPEVLQASDIDADLAISIGGLWSDLNTGGFTTRVGQGTAGSRAATIELHSEETVIGYAHYSVGMASLIPKLTEALAPHHDKLLQQGLKQIAGCEMSRKQVALPSIEESIESLNEQSIKYCGGMDKIRSQKLLTNAWWWPRISHFLEEGDCILAETGSTLFGMLDVPLPKNAIWISQVTWGSIGYAGGSVLGACLAQREKAKKTGERERTVFITGDGAWQLSIQELGTVIREGLTPLIFVINNDGYEIERVIWGEQEHYNDISVYSYEHIVKGFQPPEGYKTPDTESHAQDPKQAPTAYYALRTQDDADKLLNDPEFTKADKCTVVEVFLPRGDAPTTVRRLNITR